MSPDLPCEASGAAAHAPKSPGLAGPPAIDEVAFTSLPVHSPPLSGQERGQNDAEFFCRIANLGSAVLTHRPSENVFSPPAITNQWAMVQAGRDVCGYDDFSCPPISAAEGLNAEIYVGLSRDDVISARTLDTPIDHRWSIHGVERSTVVRHLSVSSNMTLASQHDALLMTINVENKSNDDQDVSIFLLLRLGLNGTAAHAEWDQVRGAFVMSDITGVGGGAVIGTDILPTKHGIYDRLENWQQDTYYRSDESDAGPGVRSYGMLAWQWRLQPGESRTIRYVHSLSESSGAALATFDIVRSQFNDILIASRNDWHQEVRAAFTLGNDRFSGNLPRLETNDGNLERLYYMSCLTLLSMKRTRRMGQPATVYATGGPAWTHCFLWDAQMTAFCVGLLDPAVLKKMIECWTEKDPSTFFATNYVTGESAGVKYAVNDYAMVFMMDRYLALTDDFAWLDHEVCDATIAEHFLRFATRSNEKADNDGLVDFGESRNLLECVFSYAHKVPAFNACNAWMLRRGAALFGYLGNDDQATVLHERADQVVSSVMSLYNSGSGYWSCKYPDGRLVGVRTCLDFNYILECIPEDIPISVRDRMTQFFLKELMTPTWMHALSSADPDSAYSVRTDHQDDGAFASWPAYGLQGLIRSGEIDAALTWAGVAESRGLATVALQGPWGQAYFHGGGGSPLDAGGAMKAPKEFPHLERYIEISGSMFASVIIQEFFGVSTDWQTDPLSARSEQRRAVGRALERRSVTATLYDLSIRGEVHTVRLD